MLNITSPYRIQIKTIDFNTIQCYLLIMSIDGQQETLKHNEEVGPEGELRCRICFSESKPLVSLCECAGSIAYVHEECILDWISTKMTQENGPLVPLCQICRTPYSARLRAGTRKLCFSTLRLKFCLLRLTQKWLTIYFLVGVLFCLYLLSKVLLQLIWVIVEWVWGGQALFTQQLRERPVETLFTHVVLTGCFMREAVVFLAKLKNLVLQSYIQIIEFTIVPKEILK